MNQVIFGSLLMEILYLLFHWHFLWIASAYIITISYGQTNPLSSESMDRCSKHFMPEWIQYQFRFRDGSLYSIMSYRLTTAAKFRSFLLKYEYNMYLYKNNCSFKQKKRQKHVLAKANGCSTEILLKMHHSSEMNRPWPRSFSFPYSFIRLQ